jgi:hypothetical protein
MHSTAEFINSDTGAASDIVWLPSTQANPQKSDRQGDDMQFGTQLDRGLMVKMMHRVAELSARPRHFVSAGDLVEMLGGVQDLDEGYFYINRHLVFLSDLGYLELGDQTMKYGDRRIRITSLGQIFVQPELADFANNTLLPDVIHELEQRIQILTYPEDKKNGLIFNLREAVTKQAPDLIIKYLAEMSVASMK